MRWTAALVLVLLAGACSREPTEIQLALVPAQAIGCQPTEVQTVLLRPLGDSPADERRSLRLDLSGVSTIDSFPASTEQVSVRAEGVIVRTGGGEEPWVGGGVAVFAAGEDLVVPLLRLRRGCTLSDTRAGVPDGAAVTALDDGRLIIAGGDRGLEDLRVVVVRSGDALARTVDLRGRRPRVDGTATALDEDRVLLAGGVGRETFEVIRVDAEEVVDDGVLDAPRSAHDTLRLPDGRILLVGGRSEMGTARRDAELLDLTAAPPAQRTGDLHHARIGPRLLGLDDGTVLVVGGVDDAGEPVSNVERFDPQTETFTDLGAPWPARADADYVALPGGRAARIGGLEAGTWSRAVSVLLDRGETYVSLGAILREVVERPRGVSLGDGRVLVMGRTAGGPAAQIVDPGGSRDASEASLEPLDVGREPTHAVHLVDGTVALLDGGGVSLLRVDLSGPFSDPSATISPAQADQREELSIDAPGRWHGVGDSLVADVDGARFDLPSARFRDVRVELTSSGAVELLLTPDAATPRAIAIDGGRATFGDCSVAVDGALITELLDGELRLESGGQSQSCGLGVGGRVGVAVRAAAGSGVRRLAITRL